MNARIRKETRSLQTGLLVTTAAVVAASLLFNGSDATGMVMTAFAGLSAFLGASVFGAEFLTRTMPSLLTQPLSRPRLWHEKMLVLGGTLIVAWLVTLVSICVFIKGEGKPANFPELAGATFLMILCAFCSAPYFTLACRNFLGGLVFTLLFPWAVFMLLLFLAWLIGRIIPGLFTWLTDSFDQHPDYFIAPLALIYCAVMYCSGYRLFLNFQAVDLQGKELSLPAMVNNRVAPLVEKLVPGYTGPIASLIRKELQVQRPSFIFAGAMGVLIACSGIAWKIDERLAAHGPGPVVASCAMCSIVIYLIGLPFIAGVVSMAEERNWGTVGWQFTCPVSLAKQAFVKLAVAYVTASMLGMVIPLTVASALHHGPDFASSGWQILETALWSMDYLLIFSLVVFASSLSMNTMRASALAFGLLVAAGVMIGSAGRLLNRAMPNGAGNFPRLAEKLATLTRSTHTSASELLYRAQLVTSDLSLCMVLALFGVIIFQNYRTAEITARRRWLQSSVIALALGSAGAWQAAMMIIQNHF